MWRTKRENVSFLIWEILRRSDWEHSACDVHHIALISGQRASGPYTKAHQAPPSQSSLSYPISSLISSKVRRIHFEAQNHNQNPLLLLQPSPLRLLEQQPLALFVLVQQHACENKKLLWLWAHTILLSPSLVTFCYCYFTKWFNCGIQLLVAVLWPVSRKELMASFNITPWAVGWSFFANGHISRSDVQQPTKCLINSSQVIKKILIYRHWSVTDSIRGWPTFLRIIWSN